MLKDINKKLIDSISKDSQKFVGTFLDNENEIIKDLNASKGLESEIYINNDPRELEQIRFASIFSDVISLYAGSSSNSRHHLTVFDKGSAHSYERDITVPSTLVNEITARHNLIPGYLHQNSSDLKKLQKFCLPLLKEGKAIIRPIRTLWVDDGNIINNDKPRSTIYYAEGNTPSNNWVIKDSIGTKNITIENYLRPSKLETLMQLIVPYIKNVSIENMSKILIDEEDILSNFRIELKNLILNLDDRVTNIKEYQQDVLRPKIDSVQKRFNNHKRIHSLKVYGSLGLFSLSLIKFMISNTNISEFINTVIAGGALSNIFLSEVSYQTEMNNLRENPYFLLWRLNKIN